MKISLRTPSTTISYDGDPLELEDTLNTLRRAGLLPEPVVYGYGVIPTKNGESPQRGGDARDEAHAERLIPAAVPGAPAAEQDPERAGRSAAHASAGQDAPVGSPDVIAPRSAEPAPEYRRCRRDGCTEPHIPGIVDGPYARLCIKHRREHRATLQAAGKSGGTKTAAERAKNTPPPEQATGEDIRRARLHLGLTQLLLSQQAGVSQNIISRLERGHSVGPVTLAAVQRALREASSPAEPAAPPPPGPVETALRDAAEAVTGQAIPPRPLVRCQYCQTMQTQTHTEEHERRVQTERARIAAGRADAARVSPAPALGDRNRQRPRRG